MIHWVKENGVLNQDNSDREVDGERFEIELEGFPE